MLTTIIRGFEGQKYHTLLSSYLTPSCRCTSNLLYNRVRLVNSCSFYFLPLITYVLIIKGWYLLRRNPRILLQIFIAPFDLRRILVVSQLAGTYAIGWSDHRTWYGFAYVFE